MFEGAEARMARSGPRKLLALDGGGIRGLISIEILGEIERLLREKSGRAQLVLADYFDYVAGTSTGAVIATLIALGKSTQEIRQIYLDFGEMMFDKAAILRRFAALDRAKKFVDIARNMWLNKVEHRRLPYSNYPDTPLANKLKELVGPDEVTLSTDKLKTLWMVVLSNASTDSPWPVSNNPLALFNDPKHPDTNVGIPLWQLVRASTAAPTFFPPQEIRIGPRRFVFVDGGVTPYNNPAFQLFTQATMDPYKLKWPTGEKQMLLVSVGTGVHPREALDQEGRDYDFATAAAMSLEAQFNSALYQQDLLCRMFGRCLEGSYELDMEVGDGKRITRPLEAKLFTYLRYNALLTRAGLDALGLPRIDPENVCMLDSVAFMGELRDVGRAVAQQKVKPAHFAGFEA